MHNIETKSQKLLLQKPIRWSVLFNVLIIAMLAVVFDIMILPDILPNSVPVLLFLIWYISASFISGNFIITLKRSESAWWIALLLLEIILVFFGFSSIPINNIFFRIPAYCLPVILSFVIRHYYYREKVFLFVVLFLVILFNIMKNDIIGYYNPSMFEMNRIDGFTANSTTFTAVSLFFFPVCFLLLKNKTLKSIKLISLFSIGAAAYYFFILNSRGIAFFLFLIILSGFLFSPKRSFNNMNPWYLFLTVLSSILLFYVLLNPFMNALSVIFADSERLLVKFNNITDFAQSSNMLDSNSLEARITLSIISLQTWIGGFSNFFFGKGEHVVFDNSIQGLINAGVGEHSQFFDHLARYGLLGGLFLYMAVKNTLVFILSRVHGTKMYNRTFVVLLVFILYSFMNNSLIGNILFVVFLEFPLIIEIIEIKEDISYE